MKTYIKPNTDIHQIELALMNPTSLQTNTTESFGNEDEVGAKENSFGSTSVWGEEE